MSDTKIYPNEGVLSDDYPVYFGYLYVCDGIPVSSDIQGTVNDLKRDRKAIEVRRCNMAARNLL